MSRVKILPFTFQVFMLLSAAVTGGRRLNGLARRRLSFLFFFLYFFSCWAERTSCCTLQDIPYRIIGARNTMPFIFCRGKMGSSCVILVM